VFWFATYVSTIVAANWAIATFGIVPVGFGLEAPAAVFFAGLAFTFRDLTHERVGRNWTIVAILVGAVVSGLLSPALALASGSAFLLSEFADFAVYAPLRERRWLLAVGLSNIVGFIVDSVVFLRLAFGSFDFLLGQLVGKGYMTLLAVAVLYPVRWRFRPRAPETDLDAQLLATPPSA
jgi:uncharacterized PurR-regulated membrane protein YhhQ (DUF165 family)